MNNSTDRIAIAHKDYDVRGGGEVLARHLSETFDAPMFVGRRNLENEPDEEPPDIREIDYGPLPDWLAKRCIDAYGPLRSLAYQLVWQQQHELTEFDTVITSGNEPLWFVPEDHQTVLAYTHSTPRWQYDLFHDNDGVLSVGYNYVARVLYNHNVQRPDLFVANSDLVARRINQYWNIPWEQIEVVYPPVNTRDYTPEDAETGDEYLYLGRLAGHKRVDEVVAAFNDLGDDYQLVVAGRGPEGDALREQAGDNVEFLGFVDEQQKRELYARAKALVYPPQNEDFGMVPVEAMAAGTPVIGVEEGFTRYQVQDRKNGQLWQRDELVDALREFERGGVAWTEQEIAEFARENFSVERFRRGMRNAVKQAQERAAVEPEFDTPRGRDWETPAVEPLATDGGDS